MTTKTRTTGAEDSYLRDVFAIDTRSLALLRIGIALVVLYNLYLISVSAPIFYSESGVLPLQLNQEVVQEGGGGYWSVLWFSETTNWFWLSVGLSSLAAVALLLGFQSTLATMICLIMVWSFQVRNPLVLTAGDILLRMVLFWGLFLPWGKMWSLDTVIAKKTRLHSVKITSMATAAIMVQLACIYFFSGIAKLDGSWSATALVQSLSLEMYVNGNGGWLANQTSVMKWLSYSVLLIEIVGPVLLFVPKACQFWRGVMMALMGLMHLAIWITMSIGIFSMVAMVTWLIFVPSDVWNRWLGHHNPMKRERKRSVRPHRLSQGVCGVALVFVLLLNVDKTGWVRVLPAHANSLATAMMIQQEFKMFANPPKSSPWPQYISTLRSGEVIELFQTGNEPFTGEKPHSVYRYMKSQFWRRYHFNLIESDTEVAQAPPVFQRLRKQLLNFQITQWDERQNADRQVATGSLIMNFDEFGDDGRPDGRSHQQVWAEVVAD